jgi:hypothetical protein
LAARRRSLVTPPPRARSARRNDLELGVLDVLQGTPQRARKALAMALDLPQNEVAARLRHALHAIDALDIADMERERPRHYPVHGDARRGERGLDGRHGGFVARGPFPGELMGAIPVDQRTQGRRHAFVGGGG